MRRRVGSVVLAAALVLSQDARPCCDDFWSCVGAVATLGISCKAEQIAQAIAGIHKLQATVKQVRADFQKSADDNVMQAKNDVGSAGDQMKTGAKQGVDDIKKAMDETDLLVRKQTMKLATHLPSAGGSAALAPGGAAAAGGGPQGSALAGGPAQSSAGASAQAGGAVALAPAGGTGGAAMPYNAPADPSRVAADLKRALDFIQARHKDADGKQAPLVRTKSDEAISDIQKHEPEARQTVKTRLLDPLDVVDQTLAHILEQILNPFDFSSVTGYVDQQIKLVQSRAPNTFNQMSDQLSANAGDRLKEGQGALDDIKKGADQSQKIADLAKKMADTGRQADLQKLEDLIGAPPNPMFQADAGAQRLGGARATSSSIASTALQKTGGTAKASSAKAKTLSASLAAQWGATRPLLAFAPFAVTPAMHQRVDGDLMAMFRGKSLAEAQKTRDQLLAQAKVKFASDPKTLAAVQTYLQQKTAPFLASSPAQVRR